MGRFVLKDSYFNKAKQEGYRARSAYKLMEAQKKFRLLKKGDLVLDLGCAPGSFLQVIAEIVGPGGLVVGIDLLPTKPLSRGHVKIIQGDIRDPVVGELLSQHAPEGFTVVTSDIAPNLSGIREVDDHNIEEMFEAVRALIGARLRKGGNVLLKSFFSDRFKSFQSEFKAMFKAVTIFKPPASRSASSEVYLVCTGKR